jgi:hypothetical protein
MKTYNLNIQPLGIDGEPMLTEPTLAGTLSNTIMGASIHQEPMKWFAWALELYKSGTLLLDDTDRDKLIGFITENQTLTLLGKGRMIEVFQQ